MTKHKQFVARVSRDTVLFIAGLAGIGYETVAEHGEKPTLLVLFGAMVGLPAFLRQDEKRSANPEDDDEPKGSAK